MTDYINPFEFDRASKLSFDQLNEYYIEEFNYSRFVKSKRNIFLIGERGTGKSMILLYYSFPVNLARVEGNVKSLLEEEVISVYITCNTPLYFKKEYELLEPIPAAQLSEHYIAVSIMHSIITTVEHLKDEIGDNELMRLKTDFEYIFEIELRDDLNILESIATALDKSNVEVQRWINREDQGESNKWLFSFGSGVVQLISMLKKIKILKEKHFSLLIDDAHLLNELQIKSLNSWIAYRDNTSFSFKVARTKVDIMTLMTSTGGTILEGHDFTDIDLEQSYLNKMSTFGKYARLILTRRINSTEASDIPLEEYFPEDGQYIEDYKEASKEAKAIAEKKYSKDQSKQKSINDYVYKMARAFYFRRRPPKANIPIYAGLDTILHMSNGVVRWLLHPCYYMYDRQYSENLEKEGEPVIINKIEPTIQDEIIRKRSAKEWEEIKTKLPLSVEGCSSKDAKYVYQLLDNLAKFFLKRLLNHKSEPRAVNFTISETEGGQYEDLQRLINIARKAQLIYTYLSSAKERGVRELYYMPNRILWPERQLDPIGQHARVSIKSSVLYNAAVNNKAIPYKLDGEENESDLFTQSS